MILWLLVESFLAWSVVLDTVGITSGASVQETYDESLSIRRWNPTNEVAAANFTTAHFKFTTTWTQDGLDDGFQFKHFNLFPKVCITTTLLVSRCIVWLIFFYFSQLGRLLI